MSEKIFENEPELELTEDDIISEEGDPLKTLEVTEDFINQLMIYGFTEFNEVFVDLTDNPPDTRKNLTIWDGSDNFTIYK